MHLPSFAQQLPADFRKNGIHIVFFTPVALLQLVTVGRNHSRQLVANSMMDDGNALPEEGVIAR